MAAKTNAIGQANIKPLNHADNHASVKPGARNENNPDIISPMDNDISTEVNIPTFFSLEIFII